MSWTVHKKGIPKTAAYVAVAVGDKVYSLGGGPSYMYDNIHMIDLPVQLDVHVFNTVSLRWTTLPSVTGERGERPLEVPPRVCHTAVVIEDIIYMWGGIMHGVAYCNVLYTFDVVAHKWFKPNVSGTVPGARYHHSACVLGPFMYIFGGYNDKHHWTNDMCMLDTTTMVWSLINTRGTPPSTQFHSATIIGTKMFVFGGYIGRRYNYNKNICVFDTKNNCWLSTPSAQPLPEGRTCHSAFAYNGEMYIYGGYYCDCPFNDLWKFNPDTFSWKKVETKGKGPCARIFRTCCCCKVGDRVILFGGYRINYDRIIHMYVLDLSPSLKTLCKLAVVQYRLEQSELPHNIKWELATVTSNRKRKNNIGQLKLKTKTKRTKTESPLQKEQEAHQQDGV